MMAVLPALAARPPLAPGAAANMNGAYVVATGTSAPGTDPVVLFPDSYASKGHEYFDVYAPEIATHYGENFWTDQGENPLPDHIVQRFKGKTMAITGYEQDQVMVSPMGSPGIDPAKDVSVPINWAYNHHYMGWMTGEHSEMKYLANPDPADVSAHGSPAQWVAVDRPSASLRADPSIPTKQMFSEGNGGESRKSFHGYPAGFAQLIDSPTHWHLTPMQLDTRPRACGVTPSDLHRCVKFAPSTEPRQARYGRPVRASNYSAILECPCNSRFGGDAAFYPAARTKQVARKYTALGGGVCAAGRALQTAADCWRAAVGLGLSPRRLANATASDPAAPAGCYVVQHASGDATVTFNAAGGGACPHASPRRGDATSAVGVRFQLSLDSAPAGGNATIILSGPADVWFGVGLRAVQMADQPYTLVASASGVVERQIGTCGSEAEHCPGDALAPSLTLHSNTVADGVRTLVLSRPFRGATAKHYTFDPSTDTVLPFISAIGSSATFAYHAAHAASSVLLLAPPSLPTCLCDGGTTGQLCETNGTGCVSFTKRCTLPYDGVPGHEGGDLLQQHNPTCTSASYAGGLRCCGHRRILLDADQDPGTELLRYHMKFRFWFEEYSPPNGTAAPSHYDLPRYYYQTEGWAGEYDVPPAFRRDPPIPGYPDWPASNSTALHLTPGSTCTGRCPDGDDCECIHTITYHWQISNVSMLYAGGHCHAPSCIGIELWKNDTGVPQLLCNQTTRYGSGEVQKDKFDEAGYLVLPPCLWGSKRERLQPPIFLAEGTPIFSVKRNRNTHTGHYGEMASWQMRGVPFDTATRPMPALA
ncbi:hypothetical protein AB1Y20_023535 [Prymnesium parvum]|uniref:Uncharacterized protein n=1 Tax=Prymnesium parvum TaxID=97485 RepID=A0AB34JGN1_PRYPA